LLAAKYEEVAPQNQIPQSRSNYRMAGVFSSQGTCKLLHISAVLPIIQPASNKK